jgi:hypothetical protein
VLIREEGVCQGDLQESLEVEGQQGQTEEHAQENHEKDAEDQLEVQGQHREREEVIDCQAIDHRDDSKDYVGCVTLLFLV